MTIQFHAFNNANDVATALSNRMAGALVTAVNQRGSASIAVSGGSTPIPMFQKLRDLNVPWEQVTVTLADERWVNPDSHESTEWLVKQHLLTPQTRFIPLKYPASNVDSGAVRASKAIDGIAHPFDIIILGMGDDGHTASIFPNAPLLPMILDISGRLPCMAVHDSPKAPSERITMTLPTLLSTHKLVLYFTGSEKRAVYEAALQKGSVEELPIRAILHQTIVPVDVYWAP